MKRQAKPNKRLPEWEEICAVACAVQNMHLMATSMNHIGAFWSSHTWCKSARDSMEIREVSFTSTTLDGVDKKLNFFRNTLDTFWKMPKIEFLEHLSLEDIKLASFTVRIVLKSKKKLFDIIRQELVIMFTLMRKNKIVLNTVCRFHEGTSKF